MFFRKRIISVESLSKCLEQVDLLRHFQATSSSIVPRDVEIPLRSRISTYYREGARSYQPGDSVRMLILRDLLNRDQMNVKTYFSDSEFTVHVVIDSSPSLLGHAQTGPFSLKLGIALAFAALRKRQTVQVSFLGEPSPLVSKIDEIAVITDRLARAVPQTVPSEHVSDLVRESIGHARTNTNLFFLTHIGHPEKYLYEIFNATRYNIKRSTVYPIFSMDEFSETHTIHSPDYSGFIHAPKDSRRFLEGYLENAVKIGEHLDVTVQPLLIENHVEDFLTAIEALL